MPAWSPLPMNAKLHSKEFAYILENSGAKACFVTPDLESAIPTGTAIREIGKLRGEPMPPAEGQTGRRSLALLHQRHHRRAEGRGAHASQPAVPDARLLADIDKLGPNDAVLHPAPCRTARVATHCRTLPPAR